MDSTLQSNLSVGLPLDLLVYREGEFRSDQIACIDEQNPYFQMMHSTWGHRLREVFEGIADPVWDGSATEHPLCLRGERYEAMRKITRPEDRIV
jgi:putative proteasome-type protease